MRKLFTVCAAAAVLVASAAASFAQEADDGPAVLVFSRTTDFRHLSIPNGILAIEQLGAEHGFAVEATEDQTVFTDENLARFDAVVFLLTTGTVLDDEGKAAFERYVRGGGGWAGVHSAADTEYDWPFYGELLGGAYFHSHPVQQPGVLVVEDPDHPSTAHLPERWPLFEEFYSFVRSPRGDVRVLLSIDESTYLQDPNTSHIPRGPSFPEGESGVMGDHPMSWCHDVDEGRAWYTALGHESYLYHFPDYLQHLLGGIQTAAGLVEADCSVAAAAPTDPASPEGQDPLPPDEGPDAASDGLGDDAASDDTAVAGSQQLPVTGDGTSAPLALLVLVGALALRRTALRQVP